MSAAPLTVTQVNRFARSLIEGDGRLNDILIAGEISNFSGKILCVRLYITRSGGPFDAGRWLQYVLVSK